MVLFMQYVFVQNLNWNDLLAKRIKPPFVPTIVSSWLCSLVISKFFPDKFCCPAFDASVSATT